MVETVEVSKTLEARLLPLTRHKSEKVWELYRENREALQEAFDADADTQSAVNDIVTPYNLPYQAKDALKNHVPKLLDDDTYNASELADGQPIRFVNRAAKFDSNPVRKHSFAWNVPQPGRGTNFWIPLQINPEQEQAWHQLLDEESAVSAGQLQLIPAGDGWKLHTVINYPVEDTSEVDVEERTPVGFDVGEAKLLVGCALRQDTAEPTPRDPLFIDGSDARHLRKEMYTTLKRLQERDAAQWRIDERFEYYENRLTDIVEKASRRAVDYAARFAEPVIVLENLTYIREELDYGKFMNRRLHAWAFSRLQTRIEQKAREEGIPVRYVNAYYTSQTCHACNRVATRDEQAELRCPYDDCWVTSYQCDLSAAATIADRLDPWGESLPWKTAGDDSPRNGRPGDRARTPRQDGATNGVASQISARGGGDDNARTSAAAGGAGDGQMTLTAFSVQTAQND